MRPSYCSFDPLLAPNEAAEMRHICERFGSYGMYSEEALNQGIGEGLPQRFDAAFNFARTGGRLGRREDAKTLAARTNYFRETYAYGEQVKAPGIEPFLFHQGFVEAAREIHGHKVIEPAIVFANLMIPGQELAVHTDVPEFRGANRKLHPQWLLVVMHHSGLFEKWRMPIATGISWYQDTDGGELAFYPDGPGAAPTVHRVRHNTALLLDADSIFHGVDRIAEHGIPIPPLVRKHRLVHEGGDDWTVRDGSVELARYRWDELRFSISWKAYCFADEQEQHAWRRHSDDLGLDFILDTLTDDLRGRGRLEGPRPENRELALRLVAEYVHFPPAAA